jgi:hypothetical protein
MISETIFVLTGFQTENEGVVSNDFNRLAAHRAAHFLSGRFREQLIEWHITKTGFNARLQSSNKLTHDEFSSFLSLPPSTEPCVLITREPSPDGSPLLSGLIATKQTDHVVIEHLAFKVLKKEVTPFERAPAVLVESMAVKRVLMVGLGSGGSEIALNLAASGLGELTMVDPDTVGTENYFRYITGRSDLGRKKVNVVRSQIRERELPCKTVRLDFDVVESADKLRGLLLAKPDLLVCATDSIASRRTINTNAVLMNIPCIIAGTLDEGRIGEVLLVLPYQTPCYECIRLQLGATLGDGGTDLRSPTPYVGAEQASIQSSSLRSDIAAVAALTTRAAFSLLLPARFPALPANYIVWGREADATYGPPFRFELPMSVNYFRGVRREDCPVCGEPPPELRDLDCAREAETIIASLS